MMGQVNVAMSWAQVITIAITQAISTATMFYTMRWLNHVHEKKKEPETTKNEKKTVSDS